MNYSGIGFGCYRIDVSITEHYDSLFNALENGINVIDTSSNYYDGGSEKLIGKVLNDIHEKGILKRNSIVLVTKGGYIQGQNYQYALQLEKEGALFDEVVKFQDRLWHCINPGFLEQQINLQLERLNQHYIDVYLLHNPEYYLSLAQNNGIDLNDARTEYYARIKKAFEFLEQKVKDGKILSYGISSNTFIEYSDNYEFTSLEKIISIANEVSPDNHFSTIQFPLNLLESGSVTIKNQINNSLTIPELAKTNNIKVLLNRPLNAIMSKGLVRFADFETDAFTEKDFIKQMKLVSLMEDDILNEKIINEDITPEDKELFGKLLDIGKVVEENWKFFGSIENFNDVITRTFAPKISKLIKLTDKKIKNPDIAEFTDKYVKESYLLLNYVSKYYKVRADKRSKYIHSLIDSLLEEKYHGLTLSQKTLLILKSVDGVDCVLAGLRKEKYVKDALRILNEPKIHNACKIIEYVSKEVEYSNT